MFGDDLKSALSVKGTRISKIILKMSNKLEETLSDFKT